MKKKEFNYRRVPQKGGPPTKRSNGEYRVLTAARKQCEIQVRFVTR